MDQRMDLPHLLHALLGKALQARLIRRIAHRKVRSYAQRFQAAHGIAARLFVLIKNG